MKIKITQTQKKWNIIQAETTEERNIIRNTPDTYEFNNSEYYFLKNITNSLYLSSIILEGMLNICKKDQGKGNRKLPVTNRKIFQSFFDTKRLLNSQKNNLNNFLTKISNHLDLSIENFKKFEQEGRAVVELPREIASDEIVNFFEKLSHRPTRRKVKTKGVPRGPDYSRHIAKVVGQELIEKDIKKERTPKEYSEFNVSNLLNSPEFIEKVNEKSSTFPNVFKKEIKSNLLNNLVKDFLSLKDIKLLPENYEYQDLTKKINITIDNIINGIIYNISDNLISKSIISWEEYINNILATRNDILFEIENGKWLKTIISELDVNPDIYLKIKNSIIKYILDENIDNNKKLETLSVIGINEQKINEIKENINQLRKIQESPESNMSQKIEQNKRYNELFKQEIEKARKDYRENPTKNLRDKLISLEKEFEQLPLKDVENEEEYYKRYGLQIPFQDQDFVVQKDFNTIYSLLSKINFDLDINDILKIYQNRDIVRELKITVPFNSIRKLQNIQEDINKAGIQNININEILYYKNDPTRFDLEISELNKTAEKLEEEYTYKKSFVEKNKIIDDVIRLVKSNIENNNKELIDSVKSEYITKAKNLSKRIVTRSNKILKIKKQIESQLEGQKINFDLLNNIIKKLNINVDKITPDEINTIINEIKSIFLQNEISEFRGDVEKQKQLENETKEELREKSLNEDSEKVAQSRSRKAYLCKLILKKYSWCNKKIKANIDNFISRTNISEDLLYNIFRNSVMFENMMYSIYENISFVLEVLKGLSAKVKNQNKYVKNNTFANHSWLYKNITLLASFRGLIKFQNSAVNTDIRSLDYLIQKIILILNEMPNYFPKTIN